ncbi:uncharacterized protein LOC144827271 [Lissotriton helveticus]
MDILITPPRGKRTEVAVVAPAEQEGQDRSAEGSSAGPSGTPSAQPTTSAGASTEVVTPGADAVAPVPAGTAAVGVASEVVGSDNPFKLSRKEFAIRARQRKLEAIVAESRRLVAQEEEDDQSTTTAASSSTTPGSYSQRNPPAVWHHGSAVTRRRRAAKTTAAPHSTCKARVHRLTLRVAYLEQEVERQKVLLKALRRELRDHLATGHRRPK